MRTIKLGLHGNEEMADCGFAAEHLFTGMWCLADREGRLEDRPRWLKAHIFPYHDDITSATVEALLVTLTLHGFLSRYEVEGTKYIQIANWHKHQNPHPKEPESIIPPIHSEIPTATKSHGSAVESNGKAESSNGRAVSQPGESLVISHESLVMESAEVGNAPASPLLEELVNILPGTDTDRGRTTLQRVIDKYPLVDLEYEAGRCVLFHTNSRKQIKSYALAFGNWAERASQNPTRGAARQNGHATNYDKMLDEILGPE